MKGEQKQVYKKLMSYCIFFNNVIFIRTSNSAHCRQKEFVVNNLKVVHK